MALQTSKDGKSWSRHGFTGGYGDVDLSTAAGQKAYGEAYGAQRNLAQRTPHFGVSRAEYLASKPKQTIQIPLGGGGGGRTGLGFADGGIATGSLSGYPTTLHGTEAVVPLPGNRKIPVEIKQAASAEQYINVNVEVDGGQLNSRIKKVSDDYERFQNRGTRLAI